VRKTLLAALGLTLALGALMLPSSALATSSRSTTLVCPSIQIFGVRGSGETAGGPYNGFGQTVQNVYARINNIAAFSYGGASVSAQAIDYPAVAVGDGFSSYGTVYRGSVDAGIVALDAALARYRSGLCSTITSTIVIGYSQGAQVVGDALASLPKNLRQINIAAVVLIADPRFNGVDQRMTLGEINSQNSSGIDFGNYDSRENGIAQRLSPWASPRVWPTNMSLISLCQANDPVCNFNLFNASLCTPGVPSAPCPHLHYVDRMYKGKIWTEWAAEYAVLQALGPTGPVCGEATVAKNSGGLVPYGC
jgi:predicted esterase